MTEASNKVIVPNPPKSFIVDALHYMLMPTLYVAITLGVREHAEIVGRQAERRQPSGPAPTELPAVHGVSDGGGMCTGPAAWLSGRLTHL